MYLTVWLSRKCFLQAFSSRSLSSRLGGFVPFRVLVDHVPISLTRQVAQGQGYRDFWDYYYRSPHNYLSVIKLI